MRTAKIFVVIIFVVSFTSCGIFVTTKKARKADIERLLKEEKIKFNKTEIKDIKKIFGWNYKYRKGFEHYGFVHRPHELLRYKYFYYEKIGITLKFKKKEGKDKKFKLVELSLEKPYSHNIHDSIVIGKSTFSSINGKNYKFSHLLPTNDSVACIEKNYKNYTFFSTIRIIFPDTIDTNRMSFEYEEIPKRAIIKKIRISPNSRPWPAF